MKVHNKQSLKDIRRELRQKMTPAEKLLWEELRGNKLGGLKFKRQHSIGNYIVDFYCAERRLVLELDDAVHLNSEQIKKDEDRDKTLEVMNFRVLRITNNEIEENLNLVLQTIVNY